jgi:hypothetical protein
MHNEQKVGARLHPSDENIATNPGAILAGFVELSANEKLVARMLNR